MVCPKCGKETTGNSIFCSNCGAKLTEEQPAKKTWLSTTAGVLDIIDGCISLLIVVGLMVAIAFVSDEPDTLAILVPIAVVFAVKAMLAIVGGICALQRRNWGMALVGAIAACVPLSLLGIVALILTALSRDQFRQGTASM
jgi:uncharacterized membrane protein HdeD (DUF308 family)